MRHEEERKEERKILEKKEDIAERARVRAEEMALQAQRAAAAEMEEVENDLFLGGLKKMGASLVGFVGGATRVIRAPIKSFVNFVRSKIN